MPSADIFPGQIRQAGPPRRVYGIVAHLEPAPEIINELQLRERRDATAVDPDRMPIKPAAISISARVLGAMSSGGFKSMKDSVTGVIKKIGV